MNLPKELTTVTKLSKAIALVLFVVLPFIGFYVGRIYQKSVDQYLLTSPAPAINTDPTIQQKQLNPPVQTQSWKEFKDPSGKYQFNFPDNWLISFENSRYYKDKMDVTVQGPEGKVDILWADSYGGACEDPGYEKFQFKSGEETICHAAHITGEKIPPNTEFWQLQKRFNENKSLGIYLNAYSYGDSRKLLLEIMKSLNVTGK